MMMAAAMTMEMCSSSRSKLERQLLEFKIVELALFNFIYFFTIGPFSVD